MPLDVTSFKNQVEAYHSGFNQTIVVNGQTCQRSLWGSLDCTSSSSAAAAPSITTSASASAVIGSRALADGGRRGRRSTRYVNANFNDIKGPGHEGIITEYKGLSFFPFYYFDVSEAPRDVHIPSEMRGKAAGFNVVGSITVSDPEKVFTPVSFDISSPSVSEDGYLHSIVVGFQYNSIMLIEDVLEAIYRSSPYSQPAFKDLDATKDELAAVNSLDGDLSPHSIIPNVNIPPQLEAYFPSMIQSFTLRGNKAKRIYLDGFDDIKQLFVVNMFGRGVGTLPPVMVMDNLVYTEMEEDKHPTFAPIVIPPWDFPTSHPTAKPTAVPTTAAPTTAVPTAVPTSAVPTDAPTAAPTAVPTSAVPTDAPTAAPTCGTGFFVDSTLGALTSYFNIDASSYNVNRAMGVVFTSGLAAAHTLTIELRDVSGTYAGSTAYASDTVSFSSVNGMFTITFDESQLTNIKAFSMQSNTQYCFVFYNLGTNGQQVPNGDVGLAGSAVSSPVYAYTNGYSGAYLSSSTSVFSTYSYAFSFGHSA